MAVMSKTRREAVTRAYEHYLLRHVVGTKGGRVWCETCKEYL